MTHLRMPTRDESIATLKLGDQSSEVIGNMYALYSAKHKTNYPTKKNNLPIKNNKMSKRLSYFRRFLSYFDELCLMRDQRREERRRRAAERLESHRVKTEAELDAKDEDRMVNTLGFVRCGKCKVYTSPSTMLEHISSAAVLEMDSRKDLYNREDMKRLSDLILNKGRRKPALVSDFDKYKLVLLRVETSCLSCKSKHVMECTPELVCRLQEACILLVYENMAVIKFEHDICA